MAESKNAKNRSQSDSQGGGGTKSSFQLETLKMLDTSRKKLTTIESQRIMAVLEETCSRLELVCLMNFITSNLERFRVVLGDSLTNAIQNHQSLIDSFNQNLNENISDQTHQVELQKTSDMLQLQLHHSVKCILRLFSANPAAVKMIRAEREAMSMDTQSFVAEISELKYLLLQRLLTTPLEEKQRSDYLTEVSDRTKRNDLIIQKLEAELASATNDKDAEVAKRNEVIKKLKTDIYHIEKMSEDHINRTKNESDKQQTADTKNAESKREKLMNELNQLKQRLLLETTDHRNSEQQMRSKKYQTETEVENWIQKYDQDMGEKNAEYEEINAQYNQERMQLTELEDRFRTLEEEYKAIIEERRVKKEQEEEARKNLRGATRAAISIQKFWRAYRIKKAAKRKGKKGKKSGKSGKKSGKKK